MCLYFYGSTGILRLWGEIHTYTHTPSCHTYCSSLNLEPHILANVLPLSYIHPNPEVTLLEFVYQGNSVKDSEPPAVFTDEFISS